MRKKTTEEFKKQIQDINSNIEILGEYQGNKIKISCKCKICSHEWEARPDNLFHWGCPKCNQSRGELLIETFLKENEVEYIPQYKIRIDSTINCSGEAKVDFFLPKYNTFIEYNGVQHYVAKEYFGGALQLKHQQSRDLYVKEYCTSNNINLIIIPYTLTDSQIINICKQILE